MKVHSELQHHYWWSGMRRDITRWTRECLVCNPWPGSACSAYSHPCDWSLRSCWGGCPRSALGNQYAVVFVDYMTKWREVFPVSDQSVATIANLLVREIVSLHGVPSEILSDRGRAFLSGLLQQLLRYKKINTSAYHPQTDGLVEINIGPPPRCWPKL